MPFDSILWRRLDLPGHDTCRLAESDDGWRLEGAAVFVHEQGPARLSYELECDREWRSRRGTVRGWIGARAVVFEIERGAYGTWRLGGIGVDGLEGCQDLDLGFTPATNLLAIRRLGLAPGESSQAPAAWLDVDAGTLTRLEQRYERKADGTYAYISPSTGYAAVLSVAPNGFVRRYPGLWEAVAQDGAG